VLMNVSATEMGNKNDAADAGERVAGAPEALERIPQTLAVTHPNWEPYAGSRMYGSMRGPSAMNVPTATLRFYCAALSPFLALSGHVEMSALCPLLGG